MKKSTNQMSYANCFPDTWITWWTRPQRGLGLSSFTQEQTVELSLPTCKKLRFHFAAHYDEQDVMIQDVELVLTHACIPVSFHGDPSCYVQAGSHICSDEIVWDREDTVVTLRFKIQGKRMNSGVSLLPYDEVQATPKTVFALAGIDVFTNQYQGCVVAFGDSITEQGNWTTVIKEWLASQGYRLLNLGISGNRLLRKLETIHLNVVEAKHLGLAHACNMHTIPLGKQAFGLAGQDRFLQDVGNITQLKLVLFALGSNDLFQPGSWCATQNELPDIAALQQGYHKVSTICKQHHWPLIGLCLTPFAGCEHHSKEKESLRNIYNQWLQSCRLHTDVVCFEHALMDDQGMLKQEYHDGDYLHPNALGGYQMAAMIQARLEAWICCGS